MYANINGSSKIIFSAEKKYWYKRYNVTSWDVKKSSKYDSDFDSSYETDDCYLPSSYDSYYNTSYYLYKNYTIATGGGGSFTLSNASKISWIPDPDNANQDGNVVKSYYYYLGSSFNGYYCPAYDSCRSSTASSSIIYHIKAGDTSGTCLLSLDNSEGTVTTGISVSYDYLLYAIPTGHSSSYTLIGAEAQSGWGYAKGYGPYYSDTNNKWYINGYHLLYNVTSSSISYASTSGYGATESTDDRNETYAYYFDGYYWEYLGYYA